MPYDAQACVGVGGGVPVLLAGNLAGESCLGPGFGLHPALTKATHAAHIS